MAESYVPGVERNPISVADALEAGGNILSEPVVIAQRAGTDDTLFVRGRLCYKNAAGNLVALADAETVIAIAALGDDIIANAPGAVLTVEADLASPPIPGTVTIVSTLDGDATPIFSIGPDNGHGRAESADGTFDIDYNNGHVSITFAAALGATNDVKAAYTHRILDAIPVNVAGTALPSYVLVQDTLGASVVAGDQKSVAYIKGRFRAQSLKGYSAGYNVHLRDKGIHIQA